jgi:hypothetical protein
MSVKSQIRRNSASGWDAQDILLDGEFGFEVDTGKLKIGHGAIPWSSLEYINGSGNGLGNVLVVDQVRGDDGLASIGGLPYQTVGAALSATSGITGTTVWVMPGTYEVTTGLTLSNEIALRGLNVQTCIIQMTDVIEDTTLLKMGENCRVEDLTLKLTSLGHYKLIGVQFDGTSTQTSKLRTSVVTVSNTGAGEIGSSIVSGVVCSGTGVFSESTFSFNCIKGSTINVKSNGSGTKRGIFVSGTNQVSARDTNIYVATPPNTSSLGSYVGIETNDSSGTGSIQLRATSISGPKQLDPPTFTSSDILQTTPASLTNPTYLASPGIQIGPGTDLVTKSAGAKPFSTYIYPTTLFYCGYGNIQNRYRVQQPAILSGMSVSCNVLTGADNVTVTICKNAVGGSTISNATVFTVQLDATNKTRSFYNGSVDFAVGDFVNVFIDVTGSTLHDLTIQLDMF